MYEQSLLDIKQNRKSFVVEVPENDFKTNIKERIRFLSEEKGFGAFSSFKSVLPSTTLKNNPIANTNKSKEKYLYSTN